MIETTEILDLTDGTGERSNDDHQQAQAAVIGSRHPLLPGRQASSAVSQPVTIHDIAEMTLKEEPNASNSMGENEFKDVKVGFDELCPVCGDKVSGYHYGLLTCESCKGFFKRTVQNKKVYSCVDNRNCQIDKSQRKRCPHCRFQKCLSVGMKLEAVRSDRMRGGRNKFGPMYKRDRALKQQAARQSHVHPGELPLMSNGMMPPGMPGSPEDVKPDPFVLQASLSLYSAQTSTSTSAGIMPGLVAGVNCLSSTAIVPSPSSSALAAASTSLSSSPPPAQPPHLSMAPQVLHPNQPPHLTTSTQGFASNYGHMGQIAAPHSPKTHFSHQHQQQQQHHENQHHLQRHSGNSPLEQRGSSPPSHHHANHQPSSHPHQQPPQVPSVHMQTLPNIQLPSQLSNLNQQHRQSTTNSENSPNGLSLRETEPNGSAGSPMYPNVIEALRAFQGPIIPGQAERSLLSPLMAEIKASMVDESEVKHKMLTFMQNELSQTDVMSSPEQFLPVLCRMVDQLLFLMVEWARNSSFFKEIKVEDQMKLLHHSWSEILILDFIYRQIHCVWGKEIMSPNGSSFGFEILDKLGLSDVKAKVFELIKKGKELKMDFNEYMCLKFLILLNPDVTNLENRSYIEQSLEKVNTALFEYCLLCYPEMSDKFSQLLMRLPEIRVISIRSEDYLYFKHLSNEVPDQTLLTEMLHAKRKG